MLPESRSCGSCTTVRFDFLDRAIACGPDDPRFGSWVMRADSIVLELRLALRHEHAPEVMANLEELYFFCEERHATAVKDCCVSAAEESCNVLKTLLEAWQEIEIEGKGVGAWSDLAGQLAEYEAALTELLGLLEDANSSDEALARASARLAGFGSLLSQLEEGQAPADDEFAARLNSVRLQHGLVSQAALQRQTAVGTTLSGVRELRRKANFYGASGSEVGASCDMAG